MTHSTNPESVNRKMLEALKKIERWEMPETGRTWSDGSAKSYGTLYGSLGEREYVQGIARAAIASAEQAPSSPELAALTDEQIYEIADSEECNPDDRGWGPKFSYLAFARAIERAVRDASAEQAQTTDEVFRNECAQSAKEA